MAKYPAGPAGTPNPATLTWTWRLDRHTGQWAACAPHRGDEGWECSLVEVLRPRDGKRVRVRLGRRTRAGEGWSMWEYEFVKAVS
jgi:hypothetical protein